MTIKQNINVALLGFVTILVAMLLFSTINVSAHEESEAEAVPVSEGAESTDAQVDSFNYVAQPGDSYSLMARKAVQTYGIESSTNFSGAQIIFVETNLTKTAKSPRLNLGEKVSISRELVQEWSEKAKSLTDKQQAAWQIYANNANFNTNAVGEARE